VGDPKQAIYRFRGADLNAYLAARKSIGKDALLEITTNFRSVKPILDFVNERFKSVLSEAANGRPRVAGTWITSGLRDWRIVNAPIRLCPG
jgi:ATP-dependent exoDNAse (exonuclease V) beta subunit